MPSLGAVRTSRVLLVSTPLGTLGSGLGGGVELTIVNSARALAGRGHEVTILAPEGSVLPPPATAGGPGRPAVQLIEAAGSPPPSAQHQPRDAPIVMPPEGVLAAMWEHARGRQADHDLIVNFAFDWLPFYLTSFFATPLAHLISMSSLSDALDGVAAGVARDHPGHLAVHSRAQAGTFPFGGALVVIGNGLDLDRYTFAAAPDAPGAPAAPLGWVGRIAAEKGLEDALAAAEHAGLPLHVWGVVEDAAYWQSLADRYPATFVAHGFQGTDELQAGLGRCRALLMTPKWVEAYGNVVAEALACGVPVVTYRRGGPAELVEDGVSGFVVVPDSVAALVDAVARVGELDRRACRHRAEAHCSLDAFAGRLEAWLAPLLPR